ncbi:MAG: FAD-dependent oxidoreductase [Candidatus Tectomicrobia bacterium]|uniref:FAD-dependent oxidoreductase n=1 Tax=Tectimicrobiota bacterium TaxID=2528274 RepID=A0A932CP43_UNCTE|nr:FAD-dependent oxidoreductase [Candidatus Tectomicrobia bacterium]
MGRAEKGGGGPEVDREWLRRNIRCQDACPLHTDIPEYIALITAGRYREAYALIRETNPFPSVCGRVCHRPCEVACLRGEVDEPVAINALKRFVADRVAGGEGIPTRIKRRKRERVAVIGAGPAGLTAAHDLARQGYLVTVFEAQPVAGGMLALGIPDFRLPKEEVAMEIDLIRKLGVDIRCNLSIGRDLTLTDLLDSAYEAAFVATGAHRTLALGLPGQEAAGLLEAIGFLRRVNLGWRERPGEKVAVIGEGYTAFDAARTALRLGSQVTLVCRCKRAELTLSRWEARAAEEEGVQIHYFTRPTQILQEGGRVRGLECVRLGYQETLEGQVPVPLENSRFLLEADLLLNAVGEEPELTFLSHERGLKVCDSTLLVDEETLRSSRMRIYAGGDVVTGSRTVVEAIEAGHRAAAAIGRYLAGKREGSLQKEKTELEELVSLRVDPHYDATRRQKMPRRSGESRRNSFDEVELGYDEGQALRETKRCLQCNVKLGFNMEECIVCGKCAEVCPYNCIRMVDHQGREFEPRVHREPWLIGRGMLKDDSLCIRCGLCQKACPVGEGMTLHRITWRSRLE